MLMDPRPADEGYTHPEYVLDLVHPHKVQLSAPPSVWLEQPLSDHAIYLVHLRKAKPVRFHRQALMCKGHLTSKERSSHVNNLQTNAILFVKPLRQPKQNNAQHTTKDGHKLNDQLSRNDELLTAELTQKMLCCKNQQCFLI